MTPCFQGLAAVLEKNRIYRQVHHSGAFIGNHVHKARQEGVLQQLLPAALGVISSWSETTALIACKDLQQKVYSAVLGQYAVVHRLSCFFTGWSCTVAGEIDTIMAIVMGEVIGRQKQSQSPNYSHLLRSIWMSRRSLHLAYLCHSLQAGKRLQGSRNPCQ